MMEWIAATMARIDALPDGYFVLAGCLLVLGLFALARWSDGGEVQAPARHATTGAPLNCRLCGARLDRRAGASAGHDCPRELDLAAVPEGRAARRAGAFDIA